MNKSVKELLSLRNRVQRSKLSYWNKRLAYEAIAKLARLFEVEEDYRNGEAN